MLTAKKMVTKGAIKKPLSYLSTVFFTLYGDMWNYFQSGNLKKYKNTILLKNDGKLLLFWPVVYRKITDEQNPSKTTVLQNWTCELYPKFCRSAVFGHKFTGSFSGVFAIIIFPKTTVL